MHRQGNVRLLPFVLIVFLSISLLASFAFVTPAQGQETDIFKDDFEAYAVGTSPSAGGWTLVWNGKGGQYQIVTDAKYHSPTKSFQLWGTYGWSCHVERRFSTDAKVIGFEAYVMVESYHSEEISATVGFWNREKATWGKYYATVEFTSDRYIRASSFTGEAQNLQPYAPNTWYKVKLVLDRSTNTFSVWINDELKASNLKTAESYDINALQLASRWGGVRCYYDDVRVFAVQQTQYYLRVRLDSVSLNGQSLPVDNPEIRVNAGSTISGTVTFTVENVQPGSWITPVIWVTSWERGSTANGKVRVVASDIRSTKQFNLPINIAAPTSPGTYYIGFFAGWMYSPDEVASNDHPTLYGDGDDVWDMKQSDWESVIKNGQASEGAVYKMLGRAVRVTVLQGALLPDLTIVKLEAPSSVTVGEEIKVTFTEANIGKADAGFHYDKVELIPLFITIPEKWPLPPVELPHQGLGAGASETRSFASRIPLETPAGTYLLRVTVDSRDQVREVDEGNNVREARIEIKPISLKVTVSASPTSGKAPLAVRFAASVSGGTPPYTYKWDFGDGLTSVEQSPSHTYFNPGEYVATCLVRDSVGAESAGRITIRVEAGAGVTLSFQPSEGSVAQGSVYDVEVVVSQVSDLDTAVFTLSFDPSVVEFVEARVGRLMPNAEVASNVVSSGKVRVIVNQPLGASGVTGSGSIVALRLKAVGSPGSSTTLSLLDVSLADSNANPIAVTALGGSVRITPTPVTPLKGDLNKNGILDTGDATILLRKVVGLEPISQDDISIGDMNGNGFLDTGDATIILRKVVGLE